MAKIVTITNPLTGQPAQVDQLDHTAQQIDDGLNIARGVSNPNLLDNWYFGNPVNQRGQTSYTGAGYGIDRFKIFGGVTGNLIVKDGYIEVSLTGLYSSLMQVFEKGAIVEGTYTLSVLTTSGLYKWTFEASKTTPATSPIGWFGIANAYSHFNYNADGTSNLYLFDNASSETISVSAIAAKLELGTTQTLAHQDADGNWVPNEIPDYGEQLARCQRYFLSVNTDPFGVGYSLGSGGYADILINTPVTMRDIPSLMTDGTFKCRCNGKDYDATLLQKPNRVLSQNLVEVRLQASLPASYAAVGYLAGATYLYLVADL